MFVDKFCYLYGIQNVMLFLSSIWVSVKVIFLKSWHARDCSSLYLDIFLPPTDFVCWIKWLSILCLALYNDLTLCTACTPVQIAFEDKLLHNFFARNIWKYIDHKYSCLRPDAASDCCLLFWDLCSVFNLPNINDFNAAVGKMFINIAYLLTLMSAGLCLLVFHSQSL